MTDFVHSIAVRPAAEIISARARVKAGIQCPECFGVNISGRYSRFEASPNGFQCEECGCQFGART